jgi:hypothetical protein
MHTPHLHRTEAHDEAELIDGLEPDQLEANASQPLPRMALSRGWTLAFWALRLFVLLITVLVVDVFIAGLR